MSATTTDPSPWPRPRTPALSVRARITAAVALLVAVALLGSGVVAFAIQHDRLDDQTQAAVNQEFEEFAAFQRTGVDPETARPFDDAQTLIRSFLERNVPDDDELLLAWWDGSPRLQSPRHDLTLDASFQESLRRAVETGNTTYRMDHPTFGDLLVSHQTVTNNVGSGSLVVVTMLDETRHDLRSTTQTYALISFLALVLVTGIAGWQSGRLLRPLRTLREATSDITARDLARRIPEQGNDDITALTRTINDMLDRLESGFDAQRRFLDDAGHELKTPLTIMSGHLELLDPQDPDEVADTRTLLSGEVDRMSRLVGDLILLAKSRRPDFVRTAPTDVDALLHQVLAKARGLGDRDWRVDEVTAGTALLDEQRLTQALLQLCHNAVKHTEPGDVIALGAARDGDDVDLWVRDTGPGVPEADRELVFDRFQRSQVPQGDDGSGLGLSIVRAIAEAHGGSAAVDAAPGGGALFALTIPSPQEDPWPTS